MSKKTIKLAAPAQPKPTEWALLRDSDSTEVNLDDEFILSDGEVVKVRGFIPPHKVGSSGRVEVVSASSNSDFSHATFYATVLKCTYYRREDIGKVPFTVYMVNPVVRARAMAELNKPETTHIMKDLRKAFEAKRQFGGTPLMRHNIRVVRYLMASEIMIPVAEVIAKSLEDVVKLCTTPEDGAQWTYKQDVEWNWCAPGRAPAGTALNLPDIEVGDVIRTNDGKFYALSGNYVGETRFVEITF